MIDLSQCRLKPYHHQVIGVEKLVEHPYFFIGDEMGAGKTKQVIDASQVLYIRGIIDRVLIVTPNSVRPVWFDPNFGEIAKHHWENLPISVYEYRARMSMWGETDTKVPQLRFMVTNYEFIRKEDRLLDLLPYCGSRTLLVLDESSAIKSWRAAQTKACFRLRKACARVVILNGTPIANNPGDLFTQTNILHPSILDCKSWFHYRSRYGILGGWQNKQIVAWRDLEDLQRRIAPHILRRLKKDCLDLPEKLPPVVLTTPLTPQLWEMYKEMRDQMVAWLSSGEVSSASQAIVKVMRLAQITSGFLGGIEEIQEPSDISGPIEELTRIEIPAQEVGREKLDTFFEWLEEMLEEDPNFKVVVWCRFRPELARAVKETKQRYPHIPVGVVAGGYKKEDRIFALRLLDPRTSPRGPVIVFGNPQSGGLGLNMTAAHTMFRLSNDYSHFKRVQSEDRIHRPGQVVPTSYFDLIATGPNGQRTIDHIILNALLKKEEIANWTTSAWVQALTRE